MKKVNVIILNYKVKDDALECLESVKRSSYKNIKIILVDNASGDGISQEIKQYSDIEFIQNSGNLGYTGGNNVGIKKALNEDADYIFVLNPDTLIDREAIGNLVKAAEEFSADILGPKILFPDRKTIWYAGGIFDYKNVIGKHRGVDEKDNGQYDQIEETDYVTGAAIFIKSEVFKKVGLFDERFFLYYEDSDFCFRAKKAGFKIMYIPQSIVYHKNAKSTGLGSSLQDYYITRNRLLFAFKYLTIRTKFAIFRQAIKNSLRSIRRKAFIDFLLGKFGKGEF